MLTVLTLLFISLLYIYIVDPDIKFYSLSTNQTTNRNNYQILQWCALQTTFLYATVILFKAATQIYLDLLRTQLYT